MIERHITPLIIRSLKEFPAVLLNGARQVGKSTLAKLLKKQHIIQDYITLDDLNVMDVAQRDPQGFIAQFHTPAAIDEVQRVPELLRAIKKTIDEDRKPGRFLLTGSANILSFPGVTESLAGRVDIVTLEGLSASEIQKNSEPFSLFEDLKSSADIFAIQQKWDSHLAKKPLVSRDVINDFLFFGGFPEVALKKDAYFRHRWFTAYQTSYVERDVRDLSRLLDVIAFSKLFKLLGLRTGNTINVKNLSVDAGIDQRTASRYIEILEMTFQTNTLAPWFSNATKTLVKTPKIYISDSGAACHLMNISQSNDLQNHPLYGALLETWLWSEIRKLLTLTSGVQSFFYRTYRGQEVDFLFTTDQRIWGIECKSTENISRGSLKGIEEAQKSFGDKFRGLVFYMGEKCLYLGKNLLAVPMRILF
jgi:predicted AAA+ superfamily ATPase